MRIHLLKEKTIRNYVIGNRNSQVFFEEWLSLIKKSDWEKVSDIVGTFNSSDILGGGTNRVVFNIGGNNYRVICQYSFGSTSVHLFVCWIGTHAEYTKLCKLNKQYSINVY